MSQELLIGLTCAIVGSAIVVGATVVGAWVSVKTTLAAMAVEFKQATQAIANLTKWQEEHREETRVNVRRIDQIEFWLREHRKFGSTDQTGTGD